MADRGLDRDNSSSVPETVESRHGRSRLQPRQFPQPQNRLYPLRDTLRLYSVCSTGDQCFFAVDAAIMTRTPTSVLMIAASCAFDIV